LVLNGVSTAINQGFIAMKPIGQMSNIFLLLWTSHAMETIKSLANGSTFQEISKRNFRTIQLVRPDDLVLGAFDELVQPLFKRIIINAEQTRILAELRDTLLPRLISGKLRLSEAEKLVELVL
jgi:type I restriction enzyme S subunit